MKKGEESKLKQRRVRVYSPAKINLHLEVGSQRPDGYHELRSLFAMVDLADELRVEVLENERGRCDIEGPFDFPRESNLIWKAYNSFAAATGFTHGLSVEVDKRIPEQAGLGGGSSNAASTLKLLSALSAREMEYELLLELASKLGSDVPFFLSEPCALVEGRGEVMKSVPVREELEKISLLLVLPDIKVSTAEAYKGIDTWFSTRREDQIRNSLAAEHIVSQYLHSPPQEWDFYNSFTPVLTAMYPVYERIFDILEEQNSLFSEISGSGAALFALFRSREDREGAVERIGKLGIETRKVKMLASCPEAVYNNYR